MDFDFPDELKQLRETAREFLRERCPTGVARRVLEGGEQLDRPLWREMANMGWTGASIPEEYGGAGLGRLAVCVLAEEIGRAIAPVPFASSVYLATEALLLFGSPAQKQYHLTRLASGASTGTFAYAERPGVVDPIRLESSATEGKLSGVKAPVADGEAADFAVVAVRSAEGVPSLYLVDLAAPGVTRETVSTFDPSRGHARIRFDGAPAEPLPGAIGPGAIRALLDRAAVMMAFEQVGGAEAALEMARDYALTRYAFGRPIGSFQAIKHKLADIYVALELARSNAYYGAWALHSDAAELPIAAATARIAACEAGWVATKENIQTHGGMGYTWQFDCHLYYRRAKLLGLALGSGREWKHRLIAELRARNVTGVEAA
ncbi:MAG TPA: acyl-CoA dehydrogenase family protein [Acetobacteraceae bacterium]|nr:acyl-CoA dehydrogenase family protein [Acetobacteraceae bacterium]